jgi:hypothetical protein
MAHRKPTAVLERSGAFKKNPQRKRTDPETKGALGNPPTYFSTDEKQVWKELKKNAPQNVLTNADRLFVETLCRAIAQMRATPPGELTPALLAQVRSGLGQLGMSPSDRSRVQPVTPPDKKNPFAGI